MRSVTPSSVPEAAEVLRGAAEEGRAVRLRGGGTKLGWGRVTEPPHLELATTGIGSLLEHRTDDLVAVVQAGLPLATAQAAFAEAGQMLALDPPLGDGGRATVGGVVATADSGPLRHRYGGARDLVIGATAVLSDGSVARTGGTVIKNVAGYDLAKLYTGSFGVVGLLAEVVLRLHPRSARHVTAVGVSEDPSALQAASSALAHAPLEPECLDLAWSNGTGQVLARFGGAAPGQRARRAAEAMGVTGLETSLDEDDEERWARQRAAQRASEGAVVRVSGVLSGLVDVVRACQSVGASAVLGRAGLGLFWVRLPPAVGGVLVAGVSELRARLQPWPCVVLDAPVEVRAALDVWGDGDGAAARLMAEVKRQFDPAGVCNPGVLLAGS